MSKPEDKSNKKQRTNKYSANKINEEEPKKEFPSTNYGRGLPPAVPFYCACRDCKLYFGKGTPIECVDPFIVEMTYPRWGYLGLLPAPEKAATHAVTNYNQKKSDEEMKDKRKC